MLLHIMSDSENYETTFNHFLLHFLRYLCNFCPYTCYQQAILMKVSHLGVDTVVSLSSNQQDATTLL
jgi:hypothetical protein